MQGASLIFVLPLLKSSQMNLPIKNKERIKNGKAGSRCRRTNSPSYTSTVCFLVKNRLGSFEQLTSESTDVDGV